MDVPPFLTVEPKVAFRVEIGHFMIAKVTRDNAAGIVRANTRAHASFRVFIVVGAAYMIGMDLANIPRPDHITFLP